MAKTAAPLSAREQQIVELLVDGSMSTAQIAGELAISKHTVNAYVQRVAAKLPPGDEPPLRRIMRWRLTQVFTHEGAP